MKLEQITERIYNAVGDSPKELGMSFVRPQEYYESPVFRGKIFTFEEFKNWWVGNPPDDVNPGKFIYCTYYEGFNVPSRILKPFFEGKFNPLSDWEKRLLEMVSQIRDREFYLIGTRKDAKPEDLKHEIGHGLYYTSKNYRRRVNSVLKSLNPRTKQKLLRYVQSMDYHPSVYTDEQHAYLLAIEDNLEEAGISERETREISAKLNKIYSAVLKAQRTS
jgi:hypothetical protein